MQNLTWRSSNFAIETQDIRESKLARVSLKGGIGNTEIGNGNAEIGNIFMLIIACRPLLECGSDICVCIGRLLPLLQLELKNEAYLPSHKHAYVDISSTFYLSGSNITRYLLLY